MFSSTTATIIFVADPGAQRVEYQQLCFRLVDSESEEVVSDSTCINIFITACRLLPPELTLFDTDGKSLYSFPAAKSGTVTVGYTLKSMDSGDCAEGNDFLFFSNSPRLQLVSREEHTLKSGEQVSGQLTLSFGEYTEPFATSVSIAAASATAGLIYGAVALDGVAVASLCRDVPDTPLVLSVATKSGYSLKTTHVITWSSCKPAYRCCGPLKYHFYENGSEVAVTSSLTLERSGRVSGRRYEYKVVAEDVNGVLSPDEPHVCGNVFVAIGEKPDLTKLYRLITALILSVVVIVITTAVSLITMKRVNLVSELKNYS